MNVRCRPLGDFPAEFHGDRVPSVFRAGWVNTLYRLKHELGQLGATEVVIEAQFGEGDVKLDGWPPATARPRGAAVVISFDSKHGPLRYGTDVFPDWRSNVRAIALGLEALRKVERYGVGRRGEQYRGWRALPSGAADADVEVVARGRALIAEHGGVTAALKATHPDRGGDPIDFNAVMAAR